MTNDFLYFIGIDVSKDKVDIFSTETSSHFTAKNTKKAIRHALYRGFDKENTLVILENTGGYERVCIETLNTIGFKIHRANNNRVKNFIRYSGVKAKTDKCDAKSLADYGRCTYLDPDKRKNLVIYLQPSKTQEAIRQTALYIRKLKKMRAAMKNRVKSPGCNETQGSSNRIVDFINEEIEKLESVIEELIKQNKETRQKYDLLMEYSGIGKITATELIAFLPELGTAEKKQLISLAGLAPHPNDSGTMKGYRTTKGVKGEGKRYRPDLKRILFFPAQSAIIHNKNISPYYERKLSEGKKPISAMTACMRKMLVQLNAITKRGSILF